MTWKVSDLLREGALNISPRHVIVGGISTLMLSVLGVATAWAAADAVAQEVAHRAAGGLVWVATAGSSETLSAEQCDALARQEGVVAAGGPLVEAEHEYRPFIAARALPSVAVTPGALAVWGEMESGDLWSGSDLAATGQARAGSTVVSDGQVLLVKGVLSASLPIASLRSHLVTIAPAVGQVRECWVSFEPGTYSSGKQFLEAAFGDEPVRAAPFLEARPGVRTAQQVWAQYVDRQPWLVTGFAIALIVGLLTWTRRAELAVYRTFGAGAVDRWILLTSELALVTVAACGVATTATLLVAAAVVPLTAEVALSALRQIGAAAIAGFAMGAVVAVAAGRGNIAGQLKDR